ncbi:MAG: SP_1767 family glycosyltransferase [Pseudomonadales bacterium]|nr:SP_1767 family glycosyltransferase [Pseudomonadales bacterium]
MIVVDILGAVWQRMKSLSIIIAKELDRFKKRFFQENRSINEIERLERLLNNQPYELYSKFLKNDQFLEIPRISKAEETLDYLLENKSSLCRFGDGEFTLMNGGSIHFQESDARLAKKLKLVLASNNENLLIALPDVFGDLDCYTEEVAEFWRKWLVKKRLKIYKEISMERKYYSAFFTRVYMPYKKNDKHEDRCSRYFSKIKNIWLDRDVIICEGVGTRFGLFNDFLNGAKSVSRVLCPPENAFEKYNEILDFCDSCSRENLILLALGPTATALSYDLHCKGFQAIDIGHLDIEYEWFLRKDTEGKPIENKYVDGSKEGRQVSFIEDPVYKAQIVEKIL